MQSSYVFLLLNELKLWVSIWTNRHLNCLNNSLFDFYSSLYYIFVRFTWYWIFGTTEFRLIVCVTLFQCFQECVIRFIVRVIILNILSISLVHCWQFMLIVSFFDLFFECHGIVVLYMKWANCAFEYVFVIWMRYKFLYLIFWIA